MAEVLEAVLAKLVEEGMTRVEVEEYCASVSTLRHWLSPGARRRMNVRLGRGPSVRYRWSPPLAPAPSCIPKAYTCGDPPLIFRCTERGLTITWGSLLPARMDTVAISLMALLVMAFPVSSRQAPHTPS